MVNYFAVFLYGADFMQLAAGVRHFLTQRLLVLETGQGNVQKFATARA